MQQDCMCAIAVDGRADRLTWIESPQPKLVVGRLATDCGCLVGARVPTRVGAAWTLRLT
jgi:hypothetical protein